MELDNEKPKGCQCKVEVWSRIVGYFRPTSDWNKSKKEEFADRKEYDVEKSMKHKIIEKNL